MRLFSTVAEAVINVGSFAPDRGFYFQDMKGEETRYSFPEVERATAHRSAAMQAMGLEKGDRIGLVIVEPEEFVITFLAALRVGIVPVPLYPPLSFGALDAYVERTARVLELSEAKYLIASSRLQNILWGLVDNVPTLQRLVRCEELHGCQDEPKPVNIEPCDLAFLQYTSGSTADPKGVMVTHESLVANCDAIINHALEMDTTVDKAVSWLPLYHDMGLIGFVVAPICHALETIYIPTMRFIKKPSVWMETMHQHKASISFGPNFAYALATRKAREADLERWDLSNLRVLGCGAEPIQAGTMRAFTELFHTNCGMPQNTIMPAYGMAESTLAISLKLAANTMTTNVVDLTSFQSDGVAKAPEDEMLTVEHVSCGPVFPKHEIAVMDEAGHHLGECHEGELCLRGPSVTPGYYNNPEATAYAWRGGWLHTGDLGYVREGEVYVTGRIKDLIILNGRNMHPQSIEWAAADVDGVRKGNVVAFSRPGASSEELVIALETRETDHEALMAAVKKAVRKEISVTPSDIVCLTPGTLPKTSSGKLQRRKTRQQYLAGSLGNEGNRTMGTKGSSVTVARHVARSVWSRAKNAMGR